MGYSPSVRSIWLDIGQVLFGVFIDRVGVEVHKLAKEEQSQYIQQCDRTSKDLLDDFQGKFFLWDTAGSVANHSDGFSSCLLTELAIW